MGLRLAAIWYVEDQKYMSKLNFNTVYKEMLYDGELAKYANGNYFDFHQLVIL
jgi:hypothetical protein